MYEGRKRTPMPIPEREARSRGAGDVITYTLSSEELNQYIKTGRWPREEETMKQLTKEQYLQLRLEGKTRTKIMRVYFKGTKAFYEQLEAWGIKERDAEERALELLLMPSPEPDTQESVEPAITLDKSEAPRIDVRPISNLAVQLEQLLEQYGVNGAIQSVIEERNRQDAKWGEQNHEPHFWSGILGEGFGELCEAINETIFDNGAEARAKGGYENMRREAIQVAAVAVGFVEMLDRRYSNES